MSPYAKSPTVFDGDARCGAQIVIEYLKIAIPSLRSCRRARQRAEVRMLDSRVSQELGRWREPRDGDSFKAPARQAKIEEPNVDFSRRWEPGTNISRGARSSLETRPQLGRCHALHPLSAMHDLPGSRFLPSAGTCEHGSIA